MMKKILLAILTLLLIGQISIAQNKVNCIITDIQSSLIQNKIQQNLNTTLTEINYACSDERMPQLSLDCVTSEGRENILSLWEHWGNFRTRQLQIHERGLNVSYGYKVRNIEVRVRLDDGNYEIHDLLASFDKEGKITDINLALEIHQYRKLLRTIDGNEVTDFRRRELILETVEQFRTAYNRKDIAFIKKIYSDNALIITGKVVKELDHDGIILNDQQQVIYQEQSKEEYVAKLSSVFRNNEYINIGFSDITIEQHTDPAFKEVYGVRLSQAWNTSNYNDEGTLFLIFDFKTEDEPIIHVRTWQPKEAIDKGEDYFQFGDFDLVK